MNLDLSHSVIHGDNYIDDETLFIRTLVDIRQKLQGDNYDRIRACGLLRHLLVDERPLIHIVNSKYKTKIRFLINRLKEDPNPNALIQWRNLDPIKLETSIEVNLDTFLKEFAITHKKSIFNVMDVIKGASHLLGGIHSGLPKDARDEATIQMFKESGFVVLVIKSICNVCLVAFSPLEHMILGHPPTSEF